MIFISFAAGVLTALAPCVLPLLPVIIGGSLAGDKHDRKRPYVIAVSLAVAVVAFTLILKVSTLAAGLSSQFLNVFSGVILIVLGGALVLPELWVRFATATRLEALSNRMMAQAGHDRRRLIGPVLVGLALGPVFASCSPTYAFILASVLPRNLAIGGLYLSAYAVGLAAALLAIALLGRRLTTHLGWALNPSGWFRRGFGAVLAAVGLVIALGQAPAIELWVAGHVPFDEAKLEQLLLNRRPIQETNHPAGSALNTVPTPAPDFVGLTNWINSPPLTLPSLRGKVVLVDFWTYSCINCIRTLPYIEQWNRTYHDQGLEIIGINTPEFAFEHDPANVMAAVKKFGITYPVALDNNYATWNAFHNNSWPADYLIDKNGNVRYVAIGEGDYQATEHAIQELLGVSSKSSTPATKVPITSVQTPETYFGTNRAQAFVGIPRLTNGSNSYKPIKPENNEWTLSGKWNVSGDSITSAGSDSRLTAAVTSKDVYLVASGNGTINLDLGADSPGNFGDDAVSGRILVNESRLYHMVSRPSVGNTTLTLTVPPGVTLYTFTFGS
jgi:cytochrome c biogenesis protein CcdA/thiol-disulfide isomerase/thioredoxin